MEMVVTLAQTAIRAYGAEIFKNSLQFGIPFAFNFIMAAIKKSRPENLLRKMPRTHMKWLKKQINFPA